MHPTTDTARYQPDRREDLYAVRAAARTGGAARRDWLNPRAAWILGPASAAAEECNCPDDCPRDHENE
jgi:hypothetical protein